MAIGKVNKTFKIKTLGNRTNQITATTKQLRIQNIPLLQNKRLPNKTQKC